MTTPDAAPAALPLTPDARAAASLRGTPILFGDHVWLLADYVPVLGPVWDAVFDANVLTHEYPPDLLYAAAMRLLLANYDLSPDEAADLIVMAPPEDLVSPVECALFGPPPDSTYRGYSDWAESALRANGLDPATIPPALRRAVLDQLVDTGRAIPRHQWIVSVAAAHTRSGWAMLAAAGKPPAAATAEA